MECTSKPERVEAVSSLGLDPASSSSSPLLFDLFQLEPFLTLQPPRCVERGFKSDAEREASVFVPTQPICVNYLAMTFK